MDGSCTARLICAFRINAFQLIQWCWFVIHILCTAFKLTIISMSNSRISSFADLFSVTILYHFLSETSIDFSQNLVENIELSFLWMWAMFTSRLSLSQKVLILKYFLIVCVCFLFIILSDPVIHGITNVFNFYLLRISIYK